MKRENKTLKTMREHNSRQDGGTRSKHFLIIKNKKKRKKLKMFPQE